MRPAPLAVTTFAFAALVLAHLLQPAAALAEPPRLVVVLSIDQLPREYLDRLRPFLGQRGFRRLLDSGADYDDAHYGHFVTATGPGHATMLTGAHPRGHGVIDNGWYSREQGRVVGCVEDTAFPVLGEAQPNHGASPRAMHGFTVGDVLRASSELRAKVVSVALKDRSAIFMGGVRPNGAYWFDEQTCRFTTSTYYAERLPDWVERFNAEEPCAAYVGKDWGRLREDLDYTRFASEDDMAWEGDAYGLGRTFPHPIREQSAGGAVARFAAVAASPFGNDILARFARAAIQAEELGKDEIPDLLAIGLSSQDYVGHLFGPRSQEVADMVLQADLTLSGLFEVIDFEVGMGRWTLVLTSDHGVSPVPESLETMAILPPRADHYRFDSGTARRTVEDALAKRFFKNGTPPAGFPGFFAAWGGATFPFVYAEQAAAARLGLPASVLLAGMRSEIESLDGVARVYTRADTVRVSAGDDPFALAAYRSWNVERAGDLLIQLEPYWLPGKSPAGHGTPYSYDTHVALVLYGSGIRSGRFARRVFVVDLAPTLSRLLGIEAPPKSEGEILVEALR